MVAQRTSFQGATPEEKKLPGLACTRCDVLVFGCLATEKRRQLETLYCDAYYVFASDLQEKLLLLLLLELV